MKSNITTTAAVRGQQVDSDIELRKRGRFYRFISMGGTLLIAVAGLTTATTVAAHANPLVNSTWTSIANRNSSDCVDARAHGTANGTAIEQWPCNNGLNQQFSFVPKGGGYYAIVEVEAGKVLDVTGASKADGARVELWAWNGGGNQLWLPQAIGGGYYRFVSRNSGKCLDVPGASYDRGVQLWQYTCNGSGAQSFLLITPGQNNGRGNVRDWAVQTVASVPWGIRVWLDHGQAQVLGNEYRFVGAIAEVLDQVFSHLSGFPMAVTLEEKYISCIAGIYSRFLTYDVGYGVVFDLPFVTLGCGNMWSQ